MVLKRLLKTFVVLSLLVVGALTTYYHYMDEKTPSSAALEALNVYERGVSAVANLAVDVARKRS